MIRAQDVRLLRWPLLLAVTLIALGGAALWYAQTAAQLAARAHELAQQQHSLANRQFLQARSDEHSVRDTLARYETLARRGLIGPEHRLDWVEMLDATRRQLGIDVISYEILPQRKLDKDAQGALTWMESRMRLTLRVRHAGVLLGLLDQLHRVDNALVLPLSCDISRRADSTDLDGACEVRWLTLSPESPA
ncbi:hypothetical protein O4G98_17150 [Zoogloeaceae bacterium G21618-S1]|nr:hypothetical protein [Zoogloeaceae bacterium G21618-S1]